MSKVIIRFSGPAAAKKYIEKVKKLPYVSYATDYCCGNSHSKVMVCGEFNQEQEDLLKSKKI